jgi:hypothetical protein
VKTGQVHTGGNDLRAVHGTGLDQAPGGAGQVAAACVGADDHVRVFAFPLTELHGNFIPQGFHPCNAEGCIKRGIKIAGFFQQFQEDVKQLGPNAGLNHFCAVGFTFTGFFNDFRLSHITAVVAFLDDDAF